MLMLLRIWTLCLCVYHNHNNAVKKMRLPVYKTEIFIFYNPIRTSSTATNNLKFKLQ